MANRAASRYRRYRYFNSAKYRTKVDYRNFMHRYDHSAQHRRQNEWEKRKRSLRAKRGWETRRKKGWEDT